MAGYAFTLLDHPSIYALMSDFEPDDWNQGRSSDAGRPPWNYKFKVAFKRVKQWDGRLAGTLAATGPGRQAQRSGLVPIDNGGWNYGQIAQERTRRTRRLVAVTWGRSASRPRTPAPTAAPAASTPRAASLFDQYRSR